MNALNAAAVTAPVSMVFVSVGSWLSHTHASSRPTAAAHTVVMTTERTGAGSKWSSAFSSMPTGDFLPLWVDGLAVRRYAGDAWQLPPYSVQSAAARSSASSDCWSLTAPAPTPRMSMDAPASGAS